MDKFYVAKKLYEKELKTLVQIASNTELLQKIGGVRVLLKGETGTGKTTFARLLTQSLGEKFEFHGVDTAELVSHKMGQTNLNISKLKYVIQTKSKQKSVILFFDEIDSFIMSRSNERDVGEQSRIVSYFLSFLDELPSNVILLAATNVERSIDTAVLRRFEFKITGKKIPYKFFKEGMKRTFSKNYDKGLFDSLTLDDASFPLSKFAQLVNSFEIDKYLVEKPNLFALFLVLLEEKHKTNLPEEHKSLESSYKKTRTFFV